MSTKLGQGPLTGPEIQVIKQILIALIADHGPDAVEWVWNKLAEEDPRVSPIVKQAALEASKKAGGGGAALLVLGALALGGKRKGRRK